MTWREWALKYLTEERDELRSRIAVMESGRCWFGEMRGGKRVDVTAELIERNRKNLEEIEQIIADAEAAPDA
jgi:hypothetical protein